MKLELYGRSTSFSISIHARRFRPLGKGYRFPGWWKAALEKKFDLFCRRPIRWPPLRFLLPINAAVCPRVPLRYTKKWGRSAERERGGICIIHWRRPPPLSKSFHSKNLTLSPKTTLGTISASPLPILLVVGHHPLPRRRRRCPPRGYPT